MKHVETIIIEDELSESHIDKYRTTVRGIMTNDLNQVLLVYSSLFNDYTFPGGGIKKDESEKDALKRELKEEIGAVRVDILEPFASIKEIKYSIRGTDDIFLQTSIYYVINVQEFGDQDLIGRENDHGIISKWMTIDDAIKQNESVMHDQKHQQKGLKTVLKRENTILNLLKESYHEKI